MTRSDMREHTFKILFRVPFHDKNELREQIDYYFDEFPDVKEKEYEYIRKQALLVSELSDDIDAKINEVSEGWPVERLGKAELAIMRLAVYEMLYDEDIPVNVAINEAVELAKKYGSDDNAASFVNGVLAKLVQHDTMSAREPESCQQISGERRMTITIAAIAAESSEATNRDIRIKK